MKLSVIVVNWNTAKLLSQCLDSLKFEIGNSKSETEIILVDNGSTDGSVQEIKNQISHLRQDFGGQAKIKNSKIIIKIIENKQNFGFSRAVNQGLRQAQGETFLLLNSDTQIRPNCLEKLIKFEEQVRPAVIGAKMLNSDGTTQGSCFYFPTLKRAILEYWLKGKNYFLKYAPLGKEPVEVEAVSGGAMMISRALIDKIGMLDERYFMYFEDLDFCRRAKKAGYKIYYLPTAEIIHEHGASGKNLTSPKDQWKRLIPSSEIYHGWIKHYLIHSILWLSQKCLKK